MLKGKEEKPPYRVFVDRPQVHRAKTAAATGSARGCSSAPGLIWDPREGKSKVDEVICAGCGVCADICPEGAIIKEETK